MVLVYSKFVVILRASLKIKIQLASILLVSRLYGEELSNYKPRCTCGHCSCGGVKDVQNYFDSEYVMTFLMGLNDFFAHVRGQLLFMDPIPAFNKVFSLVLQEERQRGIVIPLSNATDPSTLAFHV